MYSGSTLRNGSGKIVGVHQKIDRIARRRLNKIISRSYNFPIIKDILYFEGKNGPDGLKLKYPIKDEPWHFIDPAKSEDRALISLINDHIYNLSEALSIENSVRAAFESAWLAHAIVDGLTPAHHYPLDNKIEELWGKPRKEIMGSIKERKIIHGTNKRDTIAKNWEYWGAGGVFTAHIMYEMGVATAIASDKFESSGPSEADIIYLDKNGFEIVFFESLHKIHKLNIYKEYCRDGWTLDLALKTKKNLVPEIIKIVTLAWYQAVLMAIKKHR